MAGEAAFVDTNALVYANQENSPHHELAREQLRRLRAEGCILWLSRQVLREYLAVVTRDYGSGPALPLPRATSRVRQLAQLFEVAEDGPEVTTRLLQLVEQYPTAGRQVHDANIVATMLAHRMTRLLTFNGADFRRFVPLIILEPLAAP
ncbi:MAG TPA: PIN domain-containing protein [Geminicoccaceae bacterium]|nr:PIN domain-containing protein [Geminicoccaceae bacterium]